MMNVSVNRVISIHYSVADIDGTIVDSNLDFEPLQYLHGAGNILPALERALDGTAEGETKTVILGAGEAYGNYNKALVVSWDKNRFQGDPASLSPGLLINDPDGNEVEIVEVFTDKMIVDGNHRLAGKQLQFKVTVTSIRSADGRELLSGRPFDEDKICGPDCSCYIFT